VFTLLDNARVHAAESAVDLRVTCGKGTTALFVEDRGPGVPRVDCEEIFHRGWRGARSPGSGLGLFIARRLVLQQGGSLLVEPRPGGGASFVVQLVTASSVASDRGTWTPHQPLEVR
jgi:signal transduction histidine kinase